MSLPAMHWLWVTQATTTLAWHRGISTLNTTTNNIINSVPVGDQFNNDLVISVIYIGGVHRFQRSPQLKLDSMCFIALSLSLAFFDIRYEKLFFSRKRWCWFCVEKKHGKHLLARWWRCEWRAPTRALPKCFKNNSQTFQENQIENGHDNRFRKFA